MNWKCLFFLPTMFASLNAAWAGSNSAELTCKSESGKVELRGRIPASEIELNLKLIYDGKTIVIGNDDNAHVVEKLRKGVFTVTIERSSGDGLKLTALSQSVVNLRIPNSNKDFAFDAKLTGPRPGGPFNADGRSQNALQAILKCTYHYSI